MANTLLAATKLATFNRLGVDLLAICWFTIIREITTFVRLVTTCWLSPPLTATSNSRVTEGSLAGTVAIDSYCARLSQSVVRQPLIPQVVWQLKTDTAKRGIYISRQRFPVMGSHMQMAFGMDVPILKLHTTTIRIVILTRVEFHTVPVIAFGLERVHIRTITPKNIFLSARKYIPQINGLVKGCNPNLH